LLQSFKLHFVDHDSDPNVALTLGELQVVDDRAPAVRLASLSLSFKVSLQLWGYTSPLREYAAFTLPNGASKYTSPNCKFE
jgi:hypothetical protein